MASAEKVIRKFMIQSCLDRTVRKGELDFQSRNGKKRENQNFRKLKWKETNNSKLLSRHLCL